MEFRLFYRGKLKGDGSVQDKHEIRIYLHRQLKALWNQKPLNDYQEMLNDNYMIQSPPFMRNIEGYTFVPLVNEKVYLVADINITLLRPEEPGSIVTQSGDIDNRLKTLFDALRIPQNRNEIPNNFAPTADEKPLFCLLEDDNLISNLAVTTDRLLEPVQTNLEVVLLIHVLTKTSRPTIDYFALGI